MYCNLVNNNYRKSIENLWNYYRDEPNDFPVNNYNGNPITNPESLNTKAVLESAEVVLVLCNLVNSNCQQASNKLFGNLINIAPHSLIMLITTNT